MLEGLKQPLLFTINAAHLNHQKRSGKQSVYLYPVLKPLIRWLFRLAWLARAFIVFLKHGIGQCRYYLELLIRRVDKPGIRIKT